MVSVFAISVHKRVNGLCFRYICVIVGLLVIISVGLLSSLPCVCVFLLL